MTASRRARFASVTALALSIAAGTAADRPVTHPALTLGGYRVLAADFHIHSSTWSDGALTPFGLVLEAERQGLDAIAITGHNQLSDSRAGRWFARLVGGPTVVIGEEIHTPDHHMIALGLDRVVDWRADLHAQIEDVHRQGGVVIAAHPFAYYLPKFDRAAVDALDGAEICHPGVFDTASAQGELERFFARGSMAAIGSSDFHGFARMGLCRTYVFARDNTQDAILEAIRARRTVVYGIGGRAYGDPALVALAAGQPWLRQAASGDAPVGWLDWTSRIAGIAGLLGVCYPRREKNT